MSLKVGELHAELNLDRSSFNRGIQSAHQDFASMGRGLIGAAAGIGAAIGVALAGGALATSIATLGIAYQDQMNTLQAVTGATAAEMKAMGDRAIELGNDLTLPNTSAAGAATAMLELAKAGLSVRDAMAAAKGTLQLATAASIDEGSAATYVAQALNAWHLPGTDAVKVADMLAASANASAGTIGDMGYAMQEAGGLFAAAGIPLNDMLTAVGELSNGGIKGSMAGAQLKQAFLNLMTPTKKQVDIMKELNFHLYDSSGKMLPLRDIIGQLADSTAGLNQKTRDFDLGQLFGSNTGTMEILLRNGVKGFDDMKSAVDRHGAAAEVAAAKSQGLGGALRGLKSQWETISLQIFQKVSPALEGFVRQISNKAIPALGALGKALMSGDVAGGLAAFAETAIGGDKGNKIAQGIWSIVPPLQNIWRTIQTQVIPAFAVFWGYLMLIWDTMMSALAPMFKDLGAKGDVFKVVLQAIGIVILIVVGVIALLVLAFVGIIDVIATVVKWFQGDTARAFDQINRDVVGLTLAIRDLITEFWNIIDAASHLQGVKDITAAYSWLTGAAKPTGKGGLGGRFGGATGGIVTRPTFALIGESGPEAVVPLSRAPGASALPGAGPSRPMILPVIFSHIPPSRDQMIDIRERIRRLDREQR